MDFNCNDLMKSVLSTEILDDELRHAFDEILFNDWMEYKSQQKEKEDERRERMHEVKRDLKTLQPHHQKWKTIKTH